MSTQEENLVLDIFLRGIIHEMDVLCEFMPLRIISWTWKLRIIVSRDEAEIRCCLIVILVGLMGPIQGNRDTRIVEYLWVCSGVVL